MDIQIVLFISLLTVGFSSSILGQQDNSSANPSAYPIDFLPKIREAATSLSGELPLAINFSKVAESHRTYADIIEDGDDTRFVSARTAFQILYRDSSIMLDSGMDEEVHRYYGFGREEPYWPERNAEVQQALKAADKIIITHEHGDHVAGVIRSDAREELAPKTLLTREQVQTLVDRPQIPQIGLTPKEVEDYVVLDYERLMPVAPGIVLIKSPGHTQGHQMVYVLLSDQREFLFIGDIGWSMDNITKLKLRPASTVERIGEDTDALMQQMRWIKHHMETDSLIVIPSHDNLLLEKLAADNVIGSSLAL